MLKDSVTDLFKFVHELHSVALAIIVRLMQTPGNYLINDPVIALPVLSMVYI